MKKETHKNWINLPISYKTVGCYSLHFWCYSVNFIRKVIFM